MSTDEETYEHPRGADGRFVVGAGEPSAVPLEDADRPAAPSAPGDRHPLGIGDVNDRLNAVEHHIRFLMAKFPTDSVANDS